MFTSSTSTASHNHHPRNVFIIFKVAQDLQDLPQEETAIYTAFSVVEHLPTQYQRLQCIELVLKMAEGKNSH